MTPGMEKFVERSLSYAENMLTQFAAPAAKVANATKSDSAITSALESAHAEMVRYVTNQAHRACQTRRVDGGRYELPVEELTGIVNSEFVMRSLNNIQSQAMRA
jgi:hypothetical protein